MKKLSLVIFVALTTLMVTACMKGPSEVGMTEAEKKAAAMGAGVAELFQFEKLAVTEAAAGAVNYAEITAAGVPQECVVGSSKRDCVYKKASVFRVVSDEDLAKKVVEQIADAKLCPLNTQFTKTDLYFLRFDVEHSKATVADVDAEAMAVKCRVVFDVTAEQDGVRALILAEPVGTAAFASKFKLSLIAEEKLPEAKKLLKTFLIEQEATPAVGNTDARESVRFETLQH